MTPIDLLIEDVTLLPGTEGAPVLRGAALGIRGDRIAWIGTAGAPPARRRLALPGRVVTAGFVNVHTHAILTMVRGVAEDLGFAPAYTPGIPHGHDVTPDEACALARLGALEAMLFGSTLINDTYVHADVTAPAMAELGLRVTTCGRIHDADFSLIGDGRWEYHDAIGERTLGEAVALAETWHGKADGRIGVQLAAHAPDTCSDRLLKRIGDAADRLGLRVNTHLAQSRVEVRQVLARSGRTPAETLDDAGLLNDRLLAAHCLYLDESDLARVGRAGVHVAHIPKGNATGGTMAPTPRLRQAGARIALGTDNMHADMVEVMRWALAVARIQEGKVGADWQPADALEMATLAGARAMGNDADLGTLEVGKKADLAIFDFRRIHLTPDVNPLGNLVHVGQGRDVEHVFVDGRQVVDGGRAVLVDMDGIRRDAQRAAEALWGAGARLMAARDFFGYGGRPPDPAWPGAARVAVSFVLNIEEGGELSVAAGDPRNEPVHEVVSGVSDLPDLCMQSHFEYGTRAGYWRIAEVAARHDVPLTLNACGRAIEHSPWLARDAVARGHEICCHGWRWEEHARMAEGDERAMIGRALRAIEAACGIAPVGWHTRSAPSPNTRRLLVEHGLLYDSDAYDDDLPHYVSVEGRDHLVLPYAFDTNDMRFHGSSPTLFRGGDFAGYVADAFDWLWEEGAHAPKMMSVGLHLRIIGRPGRIAGLDAVLRHMRAKGGVWFARRMDIARHWREHHPPRR